MFKAYSINGKYVTAEQFAEYVSDLISMGYRLVAPDRVKS